MIGSFLSLLSAESVLLVVVLMVGVMTSGFSCLGGEGVSECRGSIVRRVRSFLGGGCVVSGPREGAVGVTVEGVVVVGGGGMPVCMSIRRSSTSFLMMEIHFSASD